MKGKLINNKDVLENDDISIHPFTWFSISSNASNCIARAESTLKYSKANFDHEKIGQTGVYFADLIEYISKTEHFEEQDYLKNLLLFNIKGCISAFSPNTQVYNNIVSNIAGLSHSNRIDRKKHEVLNDYQVFLKRELLFVHLLDVFEDSEKGERWLHEPNGALDNQKPIDFTNNLEGIEKVDKILGRIEHGIFS